MVTKVPSGDVVWVDAAQMREIDRVMVDELGVLLVQMMENAGRNLASLVVARYAPRSVDVYVGGGGNGGGGMAAARHLANAGVDVAVRAVGRQMSTVAALQWRILEGMGVTAGRQVGGGDVVVDALVGYGLSGALDEPMGDAMATVNAQARPVVSLDVPSGLDATTGSTDARAVRADATLTLCAPKIGLRLSAAGGALFLADISVPASVVERVTGRAGPVFTAGPIIELIGTPAR